MRHSLFVASLEDLQRMIVVKQRFTQSQYDPVSEDHTDAFYKFTFFSIQADILLIQKPDQRLRRSTTPPDWHVRARLFYYFQISVSPSENVRQDDSDPALDSPLRFSYNEVKVEEA